MATWVTPSADSQSDKAISSRVVVLKVLTPVVTLPSATWRPQPTTVSLCTSRPAQCGCRTSIAPPYAPQAWNHYQGQSGKLAPGLLSARGIIRGAQRTYRVKIRGDWQTRF